MRKFFILVFVFAVLFAAAQQKSGHHNAHKSHAPTHSHDIGVILGGSYYLGELNPAKHFNMTKPAFGVFYRFNQNYRVSYRAGFNYGTIMGDDSQSDDDDQLMRNLNFKSKLNEFHALAEFNFWEYRINNGKHFFSPYIFLGLAVLHHKPMAEYGGKYVELQPLATEGQGTTLDPTRKKYKLTQVTVPFGLGAKLNLARNVGLSLEWGMRKTFTDYLDDVSKQYVDPVRLAAEKGAIAALLANRSNNQDPTYNIVGTQRGNPYIKDWYCFFGFQVSIQLHGRENSCKSF